MALTEQNPGDALWTFRLRYKTQAEAAEVLGISQAYLSDMLNGRRDITESMLAKLGLKTIVVKATR